MNLDDLTLGQLKQLQSLVPSNDAHPYEVGKNDFLPFYRR